MKSQLRDTQAETMGLGNVRGRDCKYALCHFLISCSAARHDSQEHSNFPSYYLNFLCCYGGTGRS